MKPEHHSSPPIICGRTLQGWMDEPAGVFGKAVRATIDPKWGKDPNDMLLFEVSVRCEKSVYESFVYRIEAATVDEAQDEAIERANDYGRWDDISIEKIKEIE